MTVFSGPLSTAIDDRAAVLRNRRGDSFRRREDDGHLAAPLDALHQPRPLGDQRQAVFQAHHAGDARGRVLADAVAQHDVRLDAPRLPQLGQRIFQREQRRLRVLGLMHERLRIVGRARSPDTGRRRSDSPSHSSLQDLVARVERLRETPAATRTARGPCRRIADPWPGEQERHLGPADRADCAPASPPAGAASPGGQARESLLQLRRVRRPTIAAR